MALIPKVTTVARSNSMVSNKVGNSLSKVGSNRSKVGLSNRNKVGSNHNKAIPSSLSKAGHKILNKDILNSPHKVGLNSKH